jgi:hypothetical protein
MGYTPPSGTRLLMIDADDDTQVNAGATDVYTLQPNPGEIYQVISFYWLAPAIGGVAGDHILQIERVAALPWRHWRIENPGANNVSYNYDQAQNYDSQTPSSAREQHALHRHLWCDNDNPLLFEYDNDSDTNQTGQRYLRILVRVFTEGS